MLKKLMISLLVIFMITILFPPSLNQALGATNDCSSISTAGNKQTAACKLNIPSIKQSLTQAFGTVNNISSISTAVNTVQATTLELNIQSLTNWVLDEPTNTLYAISQQNKTLYFINASTMKVEKSLALTGCPSDIIKDSGKLYLTLDDINKIVIVDMQSRAITKTLNTSSDPYRVVKDGNKLYYAERDQWCYIYAYDLTANTDQRLELGLIYNPDLAINTDKHILYIGEAGSSGSDLIYYSTMENKIIGKSNYDDGYGYPSPERYTLFDGANTYFASRSFLPDNPNRCNGDFADTVIFAKNNFTFTKSSIYDSTTHVKLGDYSSNIDLVETSSSTIYLYNRSTGSIKSFNNLNATINNSNIISLISGIVAVPIQSYTNSVQVSPQSSSLQMNSNLTQWVLDNATDTLYGISSVDKALFFVNATTLNLEKSITFTSGPTDIIAEKGNLYISLDDINQIAIVNMENRTRSGTLYTSSDPYRIAIDGNKLYYTERDQWCHIYAYDLTANADQRLELGLIYNPDLAVNTDKHILYIGESGSSGSNMIYYSTTENKVIGKTNYNGGYGFSYPKRYTLFDGEAVYYASREFEPENPNSIVGSFGGDIIFAKYGLAFTNTAAYDSYSTSELQDFGVQLDLVELSKGADLYLYNVAEKCIVKIKPTTAPPIVNSVSPNTGLVKGGTVVNITGTGFTGATNVYFGNNLGTNLVVNSDTSITVTTPTSSDIGYVHIIVESTNLTSAADNEDKFLYTGLAIHSTSVNGTITGLMQSYGYGETATLTAVPDKAYSFKNWTDKSGRILSTNEVYSFKIYDNIELHANFVDNCDINKDGKVDILDLASVAKNYNMNSTNANWVSSLDLNKDRIIDIFDLVLCSKKMSN